jgi:hypothetical protein
MRVEGLKNYIEGKGVGVSGVSLFVNFIPDTVKEGIMLSSGLIRDVINYELPGYHRASFQLIARSQQYQTGYDLIAAAAKALTFGSTRDIEGIIYNFVRPQHEAVNYPISSGNLIEFSQHFDACYVVPGQTLPT